MAVVEAAVALDRDQYRRIQEGLRENGLDGWLLYDFRGNNPVAARMLGLPAMTRRYFVLLLADAEPIAITHRIEQQPWRGWIGENRPYLSWPELESTLREALAGRGAVAMEYSPDDGVPYVDRMPAGVLELVRSSGVTVRSSADLVSAFYSRWSDDGYASHIRAARILQETARGAFERIGEVVNATVKRFESGDIIAEVGRIEAQIPRKEQSRAENYAIGDRVRTIIKAVSKKSSMGMQVAEADPFVERSIPAREVRFDIDFAATPASVVVRDPSTMWPVVVHSVVVD